MKKDAWLGHSSAKFVYYSHKDSPYFLLLVFTLIFSVCIVLIFNVIIPQAESWFSIRDESLATQGRINIIRSNTKFISIGLDKGALESDRESLISALPVEKDFASIIRAVTLSSAKAGISVDDFAFGIGSIASSSAQKSNSTITGVDAITLSLSMKGSTDGIIAFIKEVGEKLPLSEVDTVEAGENSTTLSLIFFSKPYEAAEIQLDEPILPVSAENSTLLSEISKWNTGETDVFEEVPERSSDVPLF